MSPLFIALQVAVPMMQAPSGPDSGSPAPLPAAPATPPPAPGSVPPGPSSAGAPAGDTSPPVIPIPPIRKVHWWARFEMGAGTYGFGPSNALFTELGYGGVKLWTTMDVAWMFHDRVGAGVLIGMNRRSSQPDNAPALNVASYFVTAQLPIRLAGDRLWAFYLTPRGGYAVGDQEFDNDTPTVINHMVTFGGALSFQSFAYHLGGSVAWMHTPAEAQGELGRSIDFGGLYFMLGATIDG